MKQSYPAFCKTLSDKNAYRVAVKGEWSKWVQNASDILAIKEGCYFDLEAAQKVEKFFLLLRHSKGEWAGESFSLQPWQRDHIIYPLFGWKRSNGTRRFRTGFVFIPKKNGKSTLAAGISLYLLVADGEAGAEVYNAAADRSNAMNVFGEAANMVRASPLLSRRLEVFEGIKRINFPKTNSWYQTLSADAASAEGKNIHGLIFDELHTQKSRDLWKALQGGGVGRRQPILLTITTAGDSVKSLCFEEYERTKKVLSGEIPDWTHFGYVAEADPKDDPGDPRTHAKANPGYGVSPKAEALADRWNKAKGSPEDENEFKQYHLNLWVQKATSAIPLEVWNKGSTPFDPKELLGRRCFAALDIGAVSDLTAFVLVFPMDDGTYRVICFFWCPEDRSRDRGQKRMSYAKWIKDELIETTEGSVTDYKQVRTRINEICDQYDVKALAVDYLYQGMQLASELLNEDGLPVVSYRNGVMSMAPPTRQFMDLVMAGKLHHNGSQLLRWMAGNLVMKKDASGNLMPDKAKSHEKIDGIVAIIMALGVASLPDPNAPKRSVYEDHDLLILGEDEEPAEEEAPVPPPAPRIRRVPAGFVLRN